MNYSPFQFILGIIFLVFSFRLLSQYIKQRGEDRRAKNDAAKDENSDLVRQLQQLEERVKVLERIVTDDPDDLRRQFRDLNT